jgi:hypothetical protein
MDQEDRSMTMLVRKELREVLGIAAIALGAYLVLVASLLGTKLFAWVPGLPHEMEPVPFASGGFTGSFARVTAVFAVALGFRQSAWESVRGTYLFLLHRPVRRDAIFLAKLATGMMVLLVCASVPILFYTWWAAVPGHHPSSFAWSMTVPAWRVAFLTPLVYLGAFLSGIRPARWIGTRLLPLAASLSLVLLLGFIPYWWLLGLPLALVLYVLLVTNVCFVARVRDYA